ncbi:hypothetical protein KFK09_025706 [Dendrobium nobile]|uniref:Uncharacterized protein n=1 Tax=Dendrobium nobile TaxID=94219 RepID=A0A8T3A4P1_DENNO|nr:hypothetical protein KFK09_025706 [Dendrobium nobile]
MGGKLRTKPWRWLMKGWGRKEKARPVIGVLTFEVSRLMLKTINLWQALDDDRVAVLRDETLRLQGVRKLVSDEDDFLLSLALAETMDAVHILARAVARLGSRCSNPVLLRFDYVFADLIKTDSDLCGLEYPNKKKMAREVKKMEKFIAASSNLYQEVEILAELENDLRRMQTIPAMNRQGCSLGIYKKRVSWQRQAVKNLQDASVWNRSYDFVARILARALFTIVARIKFVFGFHRKDEAYRSKTTGHLSSIYYSVSGILNSSFLHSSNVRGIRSFASGPLMNRSSSKSSPHGNFHIQNNNTASKDINEIEGDETEPQTNIFNMKLSLSLFESKRKLLSAPPSTLGAASLALHYANLIIAIEKLAASPNSIGPDVRDELYRMLPSSIRIALKMRLSSYAKNLGSSVYDPTLAEEWSDAMIKILNWLSPLAHNMIKWQSERNFEKQNFVSSTNVLLMQTLYYANQAKTEAAITELLVGLNYLWRYGRELNAKAVLDCVGSRTFMGAGR